MAETALIVCPAGCRDAVSGQAFPTQRFGSTYRIHLCHKCRGLWVVRERLHPDGLVTPRLERVP